MIEDNIPPLVACEDEDSDGWDEMDTIGEQATCLFCPSQFHTIAVALDHCRTEHKFDLLTLKRKYNMDCYSYIKMINYIRLQKPDPLIITESAIALWDDDVYLKTGEMEPWLMYDFDDLGSAPSTPHYAIDGKTPISNINLSDLQRQIQHLTFQLHQKNSLLEDAAKDIEKMKRITRTIVESADSSQEQPQRNVSSLPVSGDSDYFNSYAHYGIHHEMLTDTVRTESYRSAILNNTKSMQNKVVLDVGCGTGILSMFSAKAEAAQVIGIDQSEVVYKAMDIIRENNLHDKIQLIKGRLEDVDLPVEKVDIIISEWMGYFLLFEGMLDSVIYARDKYLKADGLLLPNRCNISLVGICDTERYNNLINYWDNVYGFTMTCMKSEIINEASVETIASDKILTNSTILQEIDLKTCTTNACEFSSKFSLTATRDGTLTCLAGYFDTFFDLESPVAFSTGPHTTRTHWQQTTFYLKDVIPMKAGDKIDGVLSCTRMTKNLRGLGVTITMGQKKYSYVLD